MITRMCLVAAGWWERPWADTYRHAVGCTHMHTHAMLTTDFRCSPRPLTRGIAVAAMLTPSCTRPSPSALARSSLPPATDASGRSVALRCGRVASTVLALRLRHHHGAAYQTQRAQHGVSRYGKAASSVLGGGTSVCCVPLVMVEGVPGVGHGLHMCLVPYSRDVTGTNCNMLQKANSSDTRQQYHRLQHTHMSLALRCLRAAPSRCRRARANRSAAAVGSNWRCAMSRVSSSNMDAMAVRGCGEGGVGRRGVGRCVWVGVWRVQEGGRMVWWWVWGWQEGQGTGQKVMAGGQWGRSRSQHGPKQAVLQTAVDQTVRSM